MANNIRPILESPEEIRPISESTEEIQGNLDAAQQVEIPSSDVPETTNHRIESPSEIGEDNPRIFK